jgi:two-component system sensor histidine kinase AtoS
MDPELMTPEERALYDARRIAERKAELTGDALKFSLIAILLLTFVWPLGICVLILWGPRHLRALYRLVVEPRLRERFLEEEIEKQVHEHLSEERRALENEHARSLEELSARVAHEIRNPITAAKSLVQQMEEDPEAPENVEYARVAMAELSRVERSVSHLLRFARDEDMRVGMVRLADVVESALETFRDRLARSGIELEREIQTEGLVEGDAEQLRRAVINLIGNAVDAASESEEPVGRVAVRLGENLAGSAVWLRVVDNGPGFDEEALAKMWSPFYTSKPAGTGLGLAITRKLVEAHGGEIDAAPSASGGAEFVVSLPKRLGGGTA